MPVRIQRKRTKGFRLPPSAIYVGRTNSEMTGWSNPFRVGGWFMIGDPDPHRAGLRMAWCQTAQPGERGFTLIEDRQMAVDWYRRLVANWSPYWIEKCRRELGGHDLACWCPLDQPCHADVLLEIANA